MVQTTEKLFPPSAPAQWTIAQTIETLSRPLPKGLIKKKGQFDYLPWQEAQRILDKYAPGHYWEIREVKEMRDRVSVTGRLTLFCSDGTVAREAVGSAPTDSGSHADPVMSAEQSAFKRACSRLGLGLGLKD